jgi:hypothetical protein
MRGLRLLLVIASLAVPAVLVGPPTASADNPQILHFAFGPFVNTYDDFCATGATVTETFSGRANVWLAPNQPVDSRNQSVSEDVFTSPSTGVTVVTHSAYSFTDVLLSGDPNGVNTHEWTFKGAAQITYVPGGGGLVHDAGNLVVDTTWSGPEFESDLLSIVVVRDAGGHPGFGGDFCALMVPALGLG